MIRGRIGGGTGIFDGNGGGAVGGVRGQFFSANAAT
jgi:hypothetical protein